MKQTKIPLITLFVLVLCGWTPFHADAQTSSSTFKYPSLQKGEVILCTDPSTGNDVVCHVDTLDLWPRFFYHDQDTGTTRMYVHPPFPVYQVEPVTTKTLEVEDMVIMGAYCYFCGSRHVYEAPLTPGTDPAQNPRLVDYRVGFLGRFPMSEIRNPACTSLSMQYATIPGTSILKRLETNDTMLAAIVQSSTTNDYGFIVMIDAATGVDYLTVYPQDPYERVTDLAFNFNTLTVASSFTNNDFLFGIRDGNAATLYGLFPTSGAPTFFNTIYRYNTSNLNILNLGSPAPTEEATHDIRISGDPLSAAVIVAYEATGEGIDEPCDNGRYNSNTNIYECAVSTTGSSPAAPAMTSAQIVSLPSDYINGLTDVRYLYGHNRTALLYNNPNNTAGTAGIIQYPEVGITGPVDCQYSWADQFSSMDLYGTQRILFAGKGFVGNQLTHFMQDLNLRNPSCVPVLPLCHSDEIDTPFVKEKTSSVLYTYEPSEWSKIVNMPRTTLSNTNTCTTH